MSSPSPHRGPVKQPGISSPSSSALESGRCARNCLCFMHDLAAAEEGRSECKSVKRPDCPGMFATG